MRRRHVHLLPSWLNSHLFISFVVPKRSRQQSLPRRASKRLPLRCYGVAENSLRCIRVCMYASTIICYETMQSPNVTVQGVGYHQVSHHQNPDFLWMISGSSWYSSADTHIYGSSRTGRCISLKPLTFLNVLRPARMEPPIHVEYFLSGGAYIFILTSFSAIFLTSFSRRSPNPIKLEN